MDSTTTLIDGTIPFPAPQHVSNFVGRVLFAYMVVVAIKYYLKRREKKY